jgi:4-amino-4-deoxy-L-arabinose transferase-like glycosyltransferase
MRAPAARQHRLTAFVYPALVVMAVAVGIFARLWFLLHDPISSDEAVAGMIGHNILHGHFQAFYWGQGYGGVEPYFLAALFLVFGQNAFVLGLCPVLLTAGAAIVTWRIGRRLVGDPVLAVLAGTVVWAAPAAGVEISTVEFGFRSTTLFCGALALLCAVRIWDGHRRLLDLAGFGLVAGVGWWSSPESIYFLLPSLALVALGLARERKSSASRRVTQGLWVFVAFCIGALPWLWDNLLSGFPSLHPGGSAVSTYAGHLGAFFERVVPMELGFDRYISGTRIIAGWLGDAALIAAEAVVVVLVAAALRRAGPGRLIALMVIAFPFLYALSPLAWWWRDGRYAVYLPVLLALASIVGLEEMQSVAARGRGGEVRASPRSWTRPAMAIAAAAAGALAFATFLTAPDPIAYSSSGLNPNAESQADIVLLLHDGIRYGFAGYWVAYRLDFLSGERLMLSPTKNNNPRDTGLYDAVVAHRQVAWLFVPGSQAAVASRQCGSHMLQAGNESEAVFLDGLTDLGVHYRIVEAGFVDAVVPMADTRLARTTR